MGIRRMNYLAIPKGLRDQKAREVQAGLRHLLSDPSVSIEQRTAARSRSESLQRWADGTVPEPVGSRDTHPPLPVGRAETGPSEPEPQARAVEMPDELPPENPESEEAQESESEEAQESESEGPQVSEETQPEEEAQPEEDAQPEETQPAPVSESIEVDLEPEPAPVSDSIEVDLEPDSEDL